MEKTRSRRRITSRNGVQHKRRGREVEKHTNRAQHMEETEVLSKQQSTVDADLTTATEDFSKVECWPSDENSLEGLESHVEAESDFSDAVESHVEAESDFSDAVESHVEAESDFSDAVESHVEAESDFSDAVESHVEAESDFSDAVESHVEAESDFSDAVKSHVEAESYLSDAVESHIDADPYLSDESEDSVTERTVAFVVEEDCRPADDVIANTGLTETEVPVPAVCESVKYLGVPRRKELIKRASSVESGICSIHSSEDDRPFHSESSSDPVSSDSDIGHFADSEAHDTLHDDVIESTQDGQRRWRDRQEAGLEASLQQINTWNGLSGDPSIAIPREDLRSEQADQPDFKSLYGTGFLHEDLSTRQDGWFLVELGYTSSAADDRMIEEKGTVISPRNNGDTRLLPEIRIEDFDATDGEADDAPTDTSDDELSDASNLRQRDARHESKRTNISKVSRAIERLSVVAPEEICSSSNGTSKGSRISECFDSHDDTHNVDSEVLPEQEWRDKTTGIRYPFQSTTSHESGFLEQRNNYHWQSLEDRSFVQDAVKTVSALDAEEEAMHTVAVDDPQDQTLREASGRESDRNGHVLIKPEVLQRQNALHTCLTKTPPYAPGEEYVCDVCGQVYSLEDHLQAHLAVHPVVPRHPALRCGGCGATFREVTDLYHHCDVNRKKVGTRCHRCRQWFSTCEDLYRHRQHRQYQKEGRGSLLGRTGFLLARHKQFLRLV